MGGGFVSGPHQPHPTRVRGGGIARGDVRVRARGRCVEGTGRGRIVRATHNGVPPRPLHSPGLRRGTVTRPRGPPAGPAPARRPCLQPDSSSVPPWAAALCVRLSPYPLFASVSRRTRHSTAGAAFHARQPRAVPHRILSCGLRSFLRSFVRASVRTCNHVSRFPRRRARPTTAGIVLEAGLETNATFAGKQELLHWLEQARIRESGQRPPIASRGGDGVGVAGRRARAQCK